MPTSRTLRNRGVNGFELIDRDLIPKITVDGVGRSRGGDYSASPEHGILVEIGFANSILEILPLSKSGLPFRRAASFGRAENSWSVLEWVIKPPTRSELSRTT